MNKTILLGGAIGVASIAFAGNVVAAIPETRVRAEIPAKYRWDFTAIIRTGRHGTLA